MISLCTFNKKTLRQSDKINIYKICIENCLRIKLLISFALPKVIHTTKYTSKCLYNFFLQKKKVNLFYIKNRFEILFENQTDKDCVIKKISDQKIILTSF
jgi:hypothetical protein